MEVCSPHLYASFGNFCVQIGPLFAAQWVFKQSEEFRNRQHFPLKSANCRFSIIIQRLTVSRIIDQFWRKWYQKKRKDVDYKLIWELYMSSRLSTYVCYAPDGLIWLNLYVNLTLPSHNVLPRQKIVVVSGFLQIGKSTIAAKMMSEEKFR